MLLLYLLLHGNHDFLEFCLSRADADSLLLPMLRVLYQAGTTSEKPNRIYMLLIVLLIFSQDTGFVCAAQSMMIRSVGWYKCAVTRQP